MFHCPVGVWVIEQHAIILSATVRSPTVHMPLTKHSDVTLQGLAECRPTCKNIASKLIRVKLKFHALKWKISDKHIYISYI